MSRGERGAGFALTALVLAAAGLRIVKADATGVIYDEALTWFRYAQTPQDALTRFRIPNNHLLNSLAIHYAERLFGGLEHGLRVPSTAAGIAFVLGLFGIARRALADPALRLAVFAATAFHFVLVDLSYLARGYALALAASTGALLWLLRLERRDPGAREAAGSVAVLTGGNFVCLGSMPTSVFLLGAVNATLFARLLARRPERARLWLGCALAVLLATGLSTFLLYRQVLGDALALSGAEVGMGRASRHLGALFATRVLAEGSGALPPAPVWIVAAALAGAAALGAAALVSRASEGTRARGEKRLLLAVAGATLLGMLVWGVLLGRPLGHPRNSVFLLPVGLLAVGGALEAALDRLAGSPRRAAARAAALAGIAAIAAWNAPSLRAVSIAGWREHSVSGPLVRELRARDPERTWSIGTGREARYLWEPLRYYAARGYRVRQAAPGERPDVLVQVEREPAFRAFGTRVSIRSEP